MNILKIVLIVNIFLISKCCSKKILGIFPCSGYSQFILAEKLMVELANRGHDVTVISLFESKKAPANYNTIKIDESSSSVADLNLFALQDKNVFENMIITYEFGFYLSELLLANTKVQNLLRSKNATFDLLIIEQFFNQAHMGFAHHFNAPFITFSSIGHSEWSANLMGNFLLPSINPVSFSGYANGMDFFERFRNMYIYLFDMFYTRFIALPKQQELLDLYFPNKIALKEIMHNASLQLLNSHVTTSEAIHSTVATIEIGSFHIETKKLPSNLQKLLDAADEGVILFSMGSNLKSSDLSTQKLKNIFKTFAKLKQTVIWKFEADDLPVELPKNLIIQKWLPQSDVLAHPNVVAFMTHGGLLSTTEAIFYGVPIIGIPIFGDQKMNIVRAVRNGFAVELPFHDLEHEDKLYEALDQVLNNPKYQENSRKLSNIIRHQPVRPLELAMFWIEYVISHNGAKHLKNASLDLNWMQLYSLDIISIYIFVMFLIYFLFKVTIIGTVKFFKTNSKMAKTDKRKLSKKNK